MKKIYEERLTPIMGWSSWNNYRVHISEEIIKQQADALVSTGLADAGYIYCNIDDGFFAGRDKNGFIRPHPKRFPNGMKVVADYIHSKGLKAGIYSEAGENTCAHIYDNPEGNTDGVGVGLYKYDQQDLRMYLNSVKVRDLWQHIDLDSEDEHIVTVPAHGTIVYKIKD